MKLKSYRFLSQKDFTYSIMMMDGEPAAFILEDEKRAIKIRGETRIPASTYAIKYRDVMTPMTERYRNRFTWFSWHLQLMNVTGFSWVYMHIGNTDEDTDACLLLGDICDLTPPTPDGFIGESTPCFKRNYLKICKELDANNPVSIQIYDQIPTL